MNIGGWTARRQNHPRARRPIESLHRLMYARALDGEFLVDLTHQPLGFQGRPPSRSYPAACSIRLLQDRPSRTSAGAEQHGVRTGNWLIWLLMRQTETLLPLRVRRPTRVRRGPRDSGGPWPAAALRRDEAARLTLEHIQQHDWRWCVVDLVGKKGDVRPGRGERPNSL
jgi:hypothetical protein